MADLARAELARLVAAARATGSEAQARFGSLTPPQLNWKPAADRWSIAQCFDHLATTDATYLPIFASILDGTKKTTAWQRVPWIPAICGRLLRQAVDPSSTKKLKAPRIFAPATSAVDGAIIRRFVDQQAQVIRYMEASAGLSLERIVLSSPVSSVITCSLLDAFRIVVAHEQRHVLQAVCVFELDGFPRRPA